MIPNVQLTPEQLAALVQNGSPMLLQAVGRAFGLGAEERSAIASGSMLPKWFWVAVAGAAGVVVGVRVYKAWPEKVPSFIAGDDEDDNE